jgi:hypothetical protein
MVAAAPSSDLVTGSLPDTPPTEPPASEILSPGTLPTDSAAPDRALTAGVPADETVSEPSLSEPDDPRTRKSAFGGQTAMLVIPRPRPARPPAEAPQPSTPLSANGSWRPEEVRAARVACEVELTGLDLTWEEAKPIGGAKGCGAAAPISVKFVNGVRLSPPAISNCRMAASFQRWVETAVQPAAERAFGERVTGMSVAASYDCRYRYNAAGGKVSEHAHANAIDISGFTLASGKRVEVLGGWQPKLVSFNGNGRFLRDVHQGGCTVFSTVLGPEANAAHASHFHFDLQARNRRFRLCE